MRCGPLRHRVNVLQPTGGSPDAYGQVPPGWSTFATVWARIEPATGRELEFAKSFEATVTHKVIIRYLAGLLPTMQIQYGSRIFAINAILDFEERRRWNTLLCTEKI